MLSSKQGNVTFLPFKKEYIAHCVSTKLLLGTKTTRRTRKSIYISLCCSTSDIKALVVACFPGSKRMRRRAEKMTTTVKNGFHLQNEAAQGSKKKKFFVCSV